MMKRIINFLCMGLILLMIFSGCSTSEENEEILRVKAGVKEQVCNTIRNAGADGIATQAAIDSLTFNYKTEKVQDDELTLEGEFSFVLGEKKYTQPFTAGGNLLEKSYTFSTQGKEMRVEDASAEEQKKQQNQIEMNKISSSEKEAIAKETAASAVLSKMKSSTYPLYSSWYDLDNSQISYGKISADGDVYTVMGKVFLYDNYGSLSKTVQFKVRTTIDSSGYVSGTLCYLED